MSTTAKRFSFLSSAKFWLIVLGSLLVLLLATRLVDLSADREEVAEAFAQTAYTESHQMAGPAGKKIHYITAGDKTKTPLLMIHGSPGSYDNWVPFITETQLLEHYFVIAIDRPGYGETSVSGGLALAWQSQAVKPLIERYFSQQKGMIIGHSYGGALALRILTDYPRAFRGGVSLAGTLSPEFQKPAWYNKVLKYTPVGWLINRNFMISNQEMWRLPKDLAVMYQQKDKLQARLALVQGGDDLLVNPNTADQIAKKLGDKELQVFYRSDLSHFIIWKDYQVILRALSWADPQQEF